MIILALRIAQLHSRKGAILLFGKFEIISKEMAGSGALLNP
jgi:hypothetical protein